MSTEFLAFLRRKIRNHGGTITFYEYMNDCLYHSRFGYYQKQKQKIGTKGDYYTSSSIHPVFASVFADVYAEICEKHRRCLPWVEIGAGTGRFAAQFLDAVQCEYPQLYHQMQYFIIEKSQYHLQQQIECLNSHQGKVNWLDGYHTWKSETAVIYSNELLDAFPVHLIERRDDHLYEVHVAWADEQQALVERLLPLTNEQVRKYLREQKIVLSNGQRLEIPIDHPQWVQEVASAVQQGVWLTIDYGYTHEELRHPRLRNGTLLCYDKHRVDENPLLKPGDKDITFHIHFDTLRSAAKRCGWCTVGLYRQNDFLLQAGILDKIENHDGQGDPFQNSVFKKNRAIMQLISGEGISQAFRVLLCVKGEAVHYNYRFTQPFSYANVKNTATP